MLWWLLHHGLLHLLRHHLLLLHHLLLVVELLWRSLHLLGMRLLLHLHLHWLLHLHVLLHSHWVPLLLHRNMLLLDRLSGELRLLLLLLLPHFPFSHGGRRRRLRHLTWGGWSSARGPRGLRGDRAIGGRRAGDAPACAGRPPLLLLLGDPGLRAHSVELVDRAATGVLRRTAWVTTLRPHHGRPLSGCLLGRRHLPGEPAARRQGRPLPAGLLHHPRPHLLPPGWPRWSDKAAGGGRPHVGLG